MWKNCATYALNMLGFSETNDSIEHSVRWVEFKKQYFQKRTLRVKLKAGNVEKFLFHMRIIHNRASFYMFLMETAEPEIIHVFSHFLFGKTVRNVTMITGNASSFDLWVSICEFWTRFVFVNNNVQYTMARTDEEAGPEKYRFSPSLPWFR